MRQKWVIGLLLVTTLVLGGILLGSQQEFDPQIAGGYGPSYLYTDPESQLWTDIRGIESNDGTDIGDVTVNNDPGVGAVNIQDGGNVLSIDVKGGAPQLDDADKIAVSLYGSDSGFGDTAVAVGDSGVLNTLGHFDAAIHTGDGYEASGTVDLGNGASYDVLITVHASTECAMIFEVGAGAEASYILYENPTLMGGTGVTEFNRDRNSTNTADTTISHTPTVTTTGTVIRTRHWGLGKAEGALNRGSWETLLRQGEEYLLRITNETNSNNYINWILRWHE